MSEHLQIVLDVVTGEVSYRLTLREAAAAKVTDHRPGLGKIPASVRSSSDGLAPLDGTAQA